MPFVSKNFLIGMIKFFFMRRTKDNQQRRIHPQTNPQSICRNPVEHRSRYERLAKKDMKAKKSDTDIIEETDHPE